MKAILISLISVSCAVLLWFVVSQEEPLPQVVVLPHPQAMPASAALSLMAYGGQLDLVSTPPTLSDVAHVPVNTPALTSDLPEEQSRYKEYKTPAAVQTFIKRRDKIIKEHWDTVNVPRLNQGLEPLDPPQVKPTPEEVADIISDLQAKVQETANDVQAGFHNQVTRIIGDLRDVGINAVALGSESLELLIKIGQAQADFQSKYIEELLRKGCHGTAGYIMSTYIHQIAEGLGNTNNMGYQQLDDLIRAADMPYRMAWEQAGENEVLREAVRIADRQRIKAMSCPTYG